MRTFMHYYCVTFYYYCVTFTVLTALGIPDSLRDRWHKKHGWRNIVRDFGIQSGATYTVTDMDANKTIYHVEKVSFDGAWAKVSKIEKVPHE